MGEVYHAAYEVRGDDRHEVHPPGLYKPSAVPRLPDGQWTGCGSGFAAYRDELGARYAGSVGRVVENLTPHARAIAMLAAKQFARGDGVDAADATPLYVRNRVALRVNDLPILNSVAGTSYVIIPDADTSEESLKLFFLIKNAGNAAAQIVVAP